MQWTQFIQLTQFVQLTHMMLPDASGVPVAESALTVLLGHSQVDAAPVAAKMPAAGWTPHEEVDLFCCRLLLARWMVDTEKGRVWCLRRALAFVRLNHLFIIGTQDGFAISARSNGSIKSGSCVQGFFPRHWCVRWCGPALFCTCLFGSFCLDQVANGDVYKPPTGKLPIVSKIWQNLAVKILHDSSQNAGEKINIEAKKEHDLRAVLMLKMLKLRGNIVGVTCALQGQKMKRRR